MIPSETNKIRNLLTKANTQKAIQSLEELLISHPRLIGFRNQIISLQSRYFMLKLESTRGNIKNEDHLIQLNQLNTAILQVIDQIDTYVETGQKAEAEANLETPINTIFQNKHQPNEDQWQQIKLKLRQKLVQLYPERERRERLASDAGIPLKDVDLQGTPISVWHRLLEEARKQKKIGSLLEILPQEYPEDDDIKTILQIWQRR